MSQSEELVPLAPEELSMLRSKYNRSIVYSVILIAVLAYLTYFVLSIWRRGSFIIGRGWVDLTVLAIVLIVGLFILLAMMGLRIPIKADIREGRKRVFVAPMESEHDVVTENNPRIRGAVGIATSDYSVNYSYYIKVRGKNYPVGMETYYKLRPGDLVEIHEAPHSGQLLAAIPVKSSRTDSAAHPARDPASRF